MIRWRLSVLGLILVLVFASVVYWVSGMPFIECAILVAAAMILNSLFAEWEDRQPGGFLNPKGKNDE